MHDRRMLALTVCAAVAAFLAAMSANMTIAGAQGVATPAAEETAGGELPHLAHINVGSCAELSHIVYKLEDVAAGSGAATPAAGMAVGDSPAASTTAAGGEAKVSTTVVNAALDDLLADEHAINIHESIEAVDTYVACGEITGAPDGGELEIEMVEQNGSGISGTATLTDNGDGTTTVVITLTEGAPGATGTPEATPVS
ncbi:MAG TPA: hypothetical protein VD789_07015 [Thermomicrobiales bacterium]|nr:hypothetical protein [Thermomicrobiales bacterium]